MREFEVVKENDILRFLRFSVTESAAATYTESALSTNLSLERGVLWLVHAVDFHMLQEEIEVPAAGTQETIVCQITRESKSTLANYNDSDLIATQVRSIKRSAAIGTDAGPLWFSHDNPIVQRFSPPILYASPTIYIAVLSTKASAATVRGRIHYTLGKADEKLFFRVAQALIG